MNKKLLKGIATACAILMMASPLQTLATEGVDSIIESTVGVDNYGDAEYMYFQQGDGRWGSKVYNAGYTIGNTGCMIASISTLMAYANPNLRYVNLMNPGLLANYLSFSGGAIIWESAENFDGSFHLVSMNIMNRGGNVKDIIWDALNNGEYIIVYADGVYGSGSGHYSPVVGWDYEKDEPIIQDVASSHFDWSRWEECGVSQIVAYSSDVNPSYNVIQKENQPLSMVHIIEKQKLEEEENRAIEAEKQRIAEFNKRVEDENKKFIEESEKKELEQERIEEANNYMEDRVQRQRSATKVEISGGSTKVLN